MSCKRDAEPVPGVVADRVDHLRTAVVVPEVALHEVAEPLHVPLRQRLVEAELFGDLVALLLVARTERSS